MVESMSKRPSRYPTLFTPDVFPALDVLHWWDLWPHRNRLCELNCCLTRSHMSLLFGAPFFISPRYHLKIRGFMTSKQMTSKSRWDSPFFFVLAVFGWRTYPSRTKMASLSSSMPTPKSHEGAMKSGFAWCGDGHDPGCTPQDKISCPQKRGPSQKECLSWKNRWFSGDMSVSGEYMS